jgi:hypothetical protein
MPVEDMKSLLFSYVNGELAEEQNKLVEARCKGNADLTKELELTRATIRLLERRRPAEMAPFFWDRLSERLDQAASTQYAWMWAAKRFIPAMVAATLIVAVFLSGRMDITSDTNDYTLDVWAYETDVDYVQDNITMTDDSILESVFFEQESNLE